MINTNITGIFEIFLFGVIVFNISFYRVGFINNYCIYILFFLPVILGDVVILCQCFNDLKKVFVAQPKNSLLDSFLYPSSSLHSCVFVFKMHGVI